MFVSSLARDVWETLQVLIPCISIHKDIGKPERGPMVPHREERGQRPGSHHAQNSQFCSIKTKYGLSAKTPGAACYPAAINIR